MEVVKMFSTEAKRKNGNRRKFCATCAVDSCATKPNSDVIRNCVLKLTLCKKKQKKKSVKTLRNYLNLNMV